jgi:hypothetical protein
MKPTLVLLVATVALVGLMGGATADAGGSAIPHNESDENATEISPGQELAGAVGAQGASVQGELWNRTLAERLDNASTPAQRAEVVADEVKLLNASIVSLEASRENLTDAWDDGELTESEYRAALSRFVVHATAVEHRANQTVRTAEDLPERTREVNDVSLREIRDLEARAEALTEFEGEISREVANETATEESADGRPSWASGNQPG